MGRYTTVQAYADNNQNSRVVSYAQATGTAAASSSGSASASAAAPAARGPVVTENVSNPYGSTAGAGSGEFHVYRHARAREMERWKQINASEAENKAEEAFQQKLAHDTQTEAEKTEKRRRKRERAKEAKRRKKNMKLGGVCQESIATNEEDGGEGGEEEFEYAPLAASEIAQGAVKSDESVRETGGEGGSSKNGGEVANLKAPPEPEGKLPFANDGSFLERMKKEMAKTESRSE